MSAERARLICFLLAIIGLVVLVVLVVVAAAEEGTSARAGGIN